MTRNGRIRVDAGGRTRIPVEVRTTDMEVLASGLSDGEVTVAPGTYYVTATFPSGRDATRQVTVDEGELSTLRFDRPADPRPRVRARRRVAAGDDAFVLVAAPQTPRLLVWTGRWLDAWRPGRETGSRADQLASAGELAPAPTGDDGFLLHPVAGRDVLVALPTSDTACTFLAVPFDEIGGEPRPTLVRHDPGSGQVRFEYPDSPANDFFAYFENGLAREARSISREMVLHGETAIAGPDASALSAILGGYVLLRANTLDDMDLWTSLLVSRFPAFPDALAIRIEYLARTGRHQEAAEALGGVEAFRCPWFRSGTSYLLDRLRLYLGANEEPDSAFNLDSEQVGEFKAIARTLGNLATWLDNTAFVSTYRDVAFAARPERESPPPAAVAAP